LVSGFKPWERIILIGQRF